MVIPVALSVVTRKRGNPNWGRPIPPAPALATEFELQVRQLQLTVVSGPASKTSRTVAASQTAPVITKQAIAVAKPPIRIVGLHNEIAGAKLARPVWGTGLLSVPRAFSGECQKSVSSIVNFICTPRLGLDVSGISFLHDESSLRPKNRTVDMGQ
jgi:hypothetical protein